MLSLSDYVASARTTLGDDAGVRLLAGSEALDAVVPDDARDADGPRAVLVAHAPLGAEVETMRRLGEVLGDRHLGVLALVVEPGALPVGPIVSAAVADGLRVVRAEGVNHRRARTVLTVTRDPQVSMAAYLGDDDVASSDSASARLVAEWLVEGLALRARLDELAQRLRGSDDEVGLLRVRVDELTTAARAERESLQAQLEEARRALRAEKARAAQGPALKARRAVSVLRQDPVGGPRRLARSAVKRLRG